MSFSPKPCAHCGGTNLLALPNVGLEYGTATTLLGMTTFKRVAGRYWWVSAVACQQCGCTQFFTSNLAELAQHVPNAQPMTASR